MPLYVNAAMNSRGRKPGEYPSAGPLAHLKDIWHVAAPTVDILAPDLYDSGFTDWVRAYALADNPLFIPEIKCAQPNAAQAFYAVGEHNAIGLCPFAYNGRTSLSETAYQAAGTAPEKKLGEDGFLASGSDRGAEKESRWKGKRIGLASVKEISIADDGSQKRIRTFNGDETHQGRHVRIGVDDFRILRVKLYEYE